MIELLQLPQPPTAEQIENWTAWLVSWLMFTVTATSFIRQGLSLIEPLLLRWHPPTPTSTFWAVWANLLWTLEYLSMSLPRNREAIRTLYAWDKKRKTLDPAPDPETPKGGDTDAK